MWCSLRVYWMGSWDSCISLCFARSSLHIISVFLRLYWSRRSGSSVYLYVLNGVRLEVFGCRSVSSVAPFYCVFYDSRASVYHVFVLYAHMQMGPFFIPVRFASFVCNAYVMVDPIIALRGKIVTVGYIAWFRNTFRSVLRIICFSLSILFLYSCFLFPPMLIIPP